MNSESLEVYSSTFISLPLFYFINLFCTYFIDLVLVFFMVPTTKESWLYKGYRLEVKLDSIPRQHKEIQEGTSTSTLESNQTFPGCH